jgi:hypothetical protein
MNLLLIKSVKRKNLKNQVIYPLRRKIFKIIMVENISDPPITTAREAMEFMSDKDLTFMATYYPMMFKAMCMMVTIENQLEIENKEIGHKLVISNPRKPKNLFLYLWNKFKQWRFFKFGKTENIER